MSNGVASIEAELGLRLFERTTRSVTPTATFRALRAALSRLVAADEAIRRLATAHAQTQAPVVRVGVSPVVDANVVDPVLEDFEKTTGARVELVELNLRELEEGLRHKALDLALAPMTSRGSFRALPMYAEPLWVIGAPGQDVGPIALRTIESHPILMMPDACGLARTTVRLFREGRVRLRRASTRSMGYALLERSALAGRGVAILPRSKVGRETPARQLILNNNDAALLEVRVLHAKGRIEPSVRRLARMLTERGAWGGARGSQEGGLMVRPSTQGQRKAS